MTEVKHHCPYVPLSLAAGEIELRQNSRVAEDLKKQNQKVITLEQGKQLSEQIGASAFFEFSAKTGENLTEMFKKAAEVALLNHIEKNRKNFSVNDLGKIFSARKRGAKKILNVLADKKILNVLADKKTLNVLADKDAEPRIVLHSRQGCGSSALTAQMVGYHFDFLDEYEPTIADSFRKQIQVQDRMVLIELLEIGSANEYSPMWIDRYRQADIIFSVCCVADTKEEVLEFLKNEKKLINDAKDADEDACLIHVLVYNKIDLLLNRAEKRKLSTKEAQQIANEYGMLCFETSAKTGENVELAVMTALEAWLFPREKSKSELFKAARLGKVNIIEKNLQEGAKINIKNSTGGDTLLHIAAFYGQRDVVKFLLAKKANPNEKNYLRETPREKIASKQDDPGYREIDSFLAKAEKEVEIKKIEGALPKKQKITKYKPNPTNDKSNPVILSFSFEGCGSSALVTRFIEDCYHDDARSKKYYYEKKLRICHQDIIVAVSDINGSEVYSEQREDYCRNSDIIFVISSVLSANHLQCISDAEEIIKKTRNDDREVIKVLICNRMDLLDTEKKTREVTTEDAQKFANEYGMLYFETSAKTGENVKLAFATAVEVWLFGQEEIGRAHV